MNWDKLKNFAIGGGLVIVWAMTLGFLKWQVGVEVDKKLAAQDLGTDVKIISMDTNIATNTGGVAENKEDNEDTRQQLRDVAAVLMRPPGGDND